MPHLGQGKHELLAEMMEEESIWVPGVKFVRQDLRQFENQITLLPVQAAGCGQHILRVRTWGGGLELFRFALGLVKLVLEVQ